MCLHVKRIQIPWHGIVGARTNVRRLEAVFVTVVALNLGMDLAPNKCAIEIILNRIEWTAVMPRQPPAHECAQLA